MIGEHGEDAPAMSEAKGIDIRELQHREGVAIVCAIRGRD